MADTAPHLDFGPQQARAASVEIPRGHSRPWTSDRGWGWLRGAAFLGVSVWLTWPVASVFFERIAGEYGDPFQTLWSWRWFRDAIVELRNPFFTDRAFYPHGGSLIYQTFDLPTALLTLPLWGVLPPVAIYNVGILFAFWLTAYAMYLFVFELTRDRLVAFCAGVLFTACPYHVAHSTASQHLASMGWLPLYFMYLNRVLTWRSRVRDAALAGLFLALASLASWYHLLFAMVGSAVVIPHAALRDRRAIASRAFVVRAATLAAMFLALAGPLLVAILVSKSKEQIAGAHDPRTYSGDLYEFFFPNAVQAWNEWWGKHYPRWTGNAAENGSYIGYSVLALASLAPFSRDRRARAWLLVALLGALLSLGPVLQIDGQATEIELPYAWLERAVPQLEFMGVPVRFGYLLYLGVIVCWAFTLARFRQRTLIRSEGARADPYSGRAQAARVVYAALAIVPLALALIEYQPGPFITTQVVVHPPLLRWGRDRTNFAVLDLTGAGWMQWHATLHRKPTTWGYLTREPAWLKDWYGNLSVVRGLRHPKRLTMKPKFDRIDAQIDFRWDEEEAPAPRLRPSFFGIEWTGSLLVPRSGAWTFYLASDDSSLVKLDETRLLNNPNEHPMRTRSVTRDLSAGEHPLQVFYEQFRGESGVRLEWRGPGQPRQVIPAEALRTPRGEPGLAAIYSQGGEVCSLDARTAQRELRALGVRYVISGDDIPECLRKGYDLEQTYHASHIRIWRVPDR